jgi:hypothetical protein
MPATLQQASKQVKQATFVARKKNLRLVRQAEDYAELVSGRRVKTQEPVRYLFGEGTPPGQIVKRAGEDVLNDGPVDDDFQPTPQDAITWLRAHPLYNVEFSEIGNEIDRPQPTEDEFIEALTDAAISLDGEAVAGLLEKERATHNRPMLVDAAQRAATKIGEANAVMAKP